MPSFTVLLSYHSTRTSYETQQKATNFEEGYNFVTTDKLILCIRSKLLTVPWLFPCHLTLLSF